MTGHRGRGTIRSQVGILRSYLTLQQALPPEKAEPRIGYSRKWSMLDETNIVFVGYIWRKGKRCNITHGRTRCCDDSGAVVAVRVNLSIRARARPAFEYVQLVLIEISK